MTDLLEENNLSKFIIGIVIVGLFLVLGVYIVFEISDTIPGDTESNSEEFTLANSSTQVLSFAPTSISTTTNNLVWLDFDGANEMSSKWNGKG